MSARDPSTGESDLGMVGKGTIGVQREGYSPRGVSRRQVVRDDESPPEAKWNWSLKSMEGR